jgi:hypothetical protein
MGKADNLGTTKKAGKLEKNVTNTQLTKKSQTNPKYELAAQQQQQQHANDLVSIQIDPSLRRIEFQKYLELFGYKPESTIIQVHIAGFFNKRQPNSREAERRMESTKRYGGTTFIVVGRTHDPSIMDNLIQPKRQDPYQRSPGYVGYLWKKRIGKIDLHMRYYH